MMKKILVIAGPTAVGKTKYAIALAKKFNGEIVSCDSMQLYRYMDIGSAKPTAEERKQVKHYLVDEIDPRSHFSVVQYQQKAKAAIADIHQKGKLPVISGGTGLYLNSLLYEMDFSTPPTEDKSYRQELETFAKVHGKEQLHHRLKDKDPDAAERIHPNNIKKVIRAIEAIELGNTGIQPFSQAKIPVKEYTPVLIGLTRDRSQLYDRINSRVEILMEQGLVEEVKGLLDMGLTEDHISMKGIGYKEIIAFHNGEYNLQEVVLKIQQNTRNYAKRQLTWLKRYDKMKWFDISDYNSDERALEEIILWLSKKR